MPPLGFSLLASIVDTSRLSEPLLSSLPHSLHVSLLSGICVTPYPFTPFSSYLLITSPLLKPEFVGGYISLSVYRSCILCPSFSVCLSLS